MSPVDPSWLLSRAQQLEDFGFTEDHVKDNLGDRVLVVAIIVIMFDILFVSLRFATRYLYGTPLGPDDYLNIPSLFFSLAISGLAILGVKVAGVGRHADVLPHLSDQSALPNYGKYVYAAECLYYVAVAFPKLAILAAFLRVFQTKPFRVAVYIVGIFVAATGVAGIITSLSSCNPFDARWDLDRFEDQCTDSSFYGKALSMPNIITTALMILLPLPIVGRLCDSTAQKLSLGTIFGVGTFAMVCAIMRMITILRPTAAIEDRTWDAADTIIWAVLESGCYVIVACLPTLRPFFFIKKSVVYDKPKNTKKSNQSTKSGKSSSSYKSNDKASSKSNLNKADLATKNKSQASHLDHLHKFANGFKSNPDRESSIMGCVLSKQLENGDLPDDAPLPSPKKVRATFGYKSARNSPLQNMSSLPVQGTYI